MRSNPNSVCTCLQIDHLHYQVVLQAKMILRCWKNSPINAITYKYRDKDFSVLIILKQKIWKAKELQ